MGRTYLSRKAAEKPSSSRKAASVTPSYRSALPGSRTLGATRSKRNMSSSIRQNQGRRALLGCARRPESPPREPHSSAPPHRLRLKVMSDGSLSTPSSRSSSAKCG